jgi:hypothetical protein
MDAQKMKLTEEETAIIYRCRQKEKMWETWGRFVAIVIGAFNIIYSLVIFAYLSNVKIYHATEKTVQTFHTLGSLASASVGILLGMGILTIGLGIKFWNGNPNRTLLLKLVERMTDQDE